MLKKKEVQTSLNTPFLRALDRLVEEGIYLNRQAAIRDALRHLFRIYRIEPFTDKSVKFKTINNSVS